MSKITVTTIAGATSGADANKVKIESGDTLESSTIGTASGAMSIKPAGTEVVNVGTTGDILVKGTTNQRAALLLRAGSNTANSQIQLGDQASDNSGRIMYDHSDDTMRFNTNGSERFRVSASGIHIGGTAAANAIGNYEEGTWTPAFSSQIGTISMNSVGGRYQRVGNFVTAIFWLNWSSISGNGSYGVQLTGLPFTSVSQIVSERDIGPILGAGHEQVPILNSNYNLLGGYMNQNATTATFRMSGGGQSERSLDGSIAKAGGYLYGTVYYKAV